MSHVIVASPRLLHLTASVETFLKFHMLNMVMKLRSTGRDCYISVIYFDPHMANTVETLLSSFHVMTDATCRCKGAKDLTLQVIQETGNEIAKDV